MSEKLKTNFILNIYYYIGRRCLGSRMRIAHSLFCALRKTMKRPNLKDLLFHQRKRSFPAQATGVLNLQGLDADSP
jgi:hypothetical protein